MRLRYVFNLELAANLTGTIDMTVFVGGMELYLAALCISVPMLRPFYARYRARKSSARLQEASGEDPELVTFSEFKNSKDKKWNRARKARDPMRITTTTETQWEMEEYARSANADLDAARPGFSAGVGGSPVVGDGSSEKRLTEQESSSDQVADQTTWRVTRDS